MHNVYCYVSIYHRKFTGHLHLFRKVPEAHTDGLIVDTAGDCDMPMRGCRVVEHADAEYQN